MNLPDSTSSMDNNFLEHDTSISLPFEMERKDMNHSHDHNPLLHAHSDAIDSLQDRMKRLEATAKRPASSNITGDNIDDRDAMEYKSAFLSYVRKGYEADLLSLEKKSLSSGNDNEGGYLIRHDAINMINNNLKSGSIIRQLASVQTINSDALDIVVDSGDFEAKWVTEYEPRNETETPKFDRKTIQTHELVAQPKATQKFIDDSGVNIDEWLATKISDIFLSKESSAFINGDGINKPRGLLSYPNGSSLNTIAQIETESSAHISTDDIMSLYYSLDERYIAKASMIMHRTTLHTLRTLKDANGQYLLQHSGAPGQPESIFGIPVYQSSDMPMFGAGNKAIIFGNISSAYQIVDRIGVRMMRDPFTEKPFVKFYTTKRVGGDLVNGNAVKIMHIKA